jgi:hypothetical protein
MTDLARLYNTLGLRTAFSTEDKLSAAVRDRAGIRDWFQTQDAYTLHRSVRNKISSQTLYCQQFNGRMGMRFD